MAESKEELNSLLMRVKELTHLKTPWCLKRLKVRGEGDDRGWDGWMASLTQWAWVWVNSGSWWWTGRHGVLQSMGSQRVGHDWVTELNWTERGEWKAGLKLNIQKTKIIESGPINSWQIEGGKFETVTFYFLVYLSSNYKAPKSLWTVTAAMKFKDTYSFESYDKPRRIKKQKHHFANKCPDSQSYGFSSRHVQMWELDHKEGWAQKNWCFWTVVLEKTLESSLDCKEIKSVNTKWNQPWIFIERTVAEAEAPILWPPDVKSQLIGKDTDDGKDGRQKEKRVAEDWLDSITDSVDMNLRKLWKIVKDRGAWDAAVHGVIELDIT